MLFIKVVSLSRPSEFTHLQFGNGETAFVDGINNFTCLSVTVGFDHGEGSSGNCVEFVFGE